MEGQNESTALTHPSDLSKEVDNLSSIAKILGSISDYPSTLRRSFRGEMMFEDTSGEIHWVQNVRPLFVKVRKGKPIKEKKTMPWKINGVYEIKEVYLAHDEAIEKIISMLQFVGINLISPVGFNQPDNYQDDLKEFECKLAALLALKQKDWGIDKELLPMKQMEIKTIIQDVRSLSVNGNFMKTIQTTVTRVEQYIENDNKKRSMMESSPY